MSPKVRKIVIDSILEAAWEEFKNKKELEGMSDIDLQCILLCMALEDY